MRIAIAGATGLIGSQLTALARKEGHDVVEIARETGFDLLAPEPGRLEAALEGADAVVDVTSTRGILDDEATLDFFTGVARNLGRAATAAGVTRTVALSIVGIETSPDYGYYGPSSPRSASPARPRPGRWCCARPSSTTSPGRCSSGTATVTSPGSSTCRPSPSTPPRSSGFSSTWPPGRWTTTSSWPGPKPERLVDLVRGTPRTSAPT